MVTADGLLHVLSRLTLLVLGALFAAPDAQAWAGEPDRPHHADLAVLAAEGLPRGARAFLLAHEHAYRDGALYPDRAMNPWFHTYEPHQGEGGGLIAIRDAEKGIHEKLARNETDADLAFRLGMLTHFFLDLGQPLHTGPDAIDNRWHAAYEDETYHHRDELGLAPPRPGRPPEDIVEHARALAWRSANRSFALEAALNESGPWSPILARLTEEALTDALGATADALRGLLNGTYPEKIPPPASREDRPERPRDAPSRTSSAAPPSPASAMGSSDEAADAPGDVRQGPRSPAPLLLAFLILALGAVLRPRGANKGINEARQGSP